MPEGFELVGVKTEDNEVIVICRPAESQIRTIGFVPLAEDCPADDDDDEEEWEEDINKPTTKL